VSGPRRGRVDEGAGGATLDGEGGSSGVALSVESFVTRARPPRAAAGAGLRLRSRTGLGSLDICAGERIERVWTDAEWRDGDAEMSALSSLGNGCQCAPAESEESR